jgi:iron(III) transport system permease protein
MAIIRWLNRDDSEVFIWLYDRTILAPVLAAVVRALPVAIVVTWWGLRTIPAELLDMARLDGLGVVGRFAHVLWPARGDMLVAAWFASFAVAAGDLSSTILVTPPGISTLSIRVFGLLHAGVDDQVAGICLVNAAVCLAMAAIVGQLLRRKES